MGTCQCMTESVVFTAGFLTFLGAPAQDPFHGHNFSAEQAAELLPPCLQMAYLKVVDKSQAEI